MENNCNIVSTKQFVDGIVRNLLKPVVTWRHWNTMAPSLTLLTEASPEAVLEKIERDMADENGDLWKLFSPSKDFLQGGNYYTYILWVLECLVWYRSCAVRSIMLLVKINERKIKYTLSNSPINTLYEIFCLWHPQNCLETKEQHDILRRIFTVYPTTGWELADKLLPSGSESCGEIQRPRWHSFDGEMLRNHTDEEFQEGIQTITALCTEFVTTAKEWIIIIKHISLFMDHYNELAEKLTTQCKLYPTKDVLQIADAFREKINRFRKFPDANWTWREEDVQRLENLLQKITPGGVEQFRYLFKNNTQLLHPIPYHDEEPYNYQAEQEKLLAERSEAIEMILTKFGVKELIEFSISAENTEDFGRILAEKLFSNSCDFDLLLRIKTKNYALYASILRSLFFANGLKKMQCIMETSEQLTNEEKGDILCHAPLSPEVWNIIDSMPEATAQYYWENKNIFRLDNKYINYQDYCLDQLLKHKRPFSAVRLIVYTEYHNTNQIMSILSECVRLQEHSEKNGSTLRSINQYDILDLFEKLYADKSVDLERLIKLEIAFFQRFKHTKTPKGLTKYFQNHPVGYVVAISQVYKDDLDASQGKEELSENEIALYYDIIESFTTVPGCNEELISEEMFRTWVSTAQDYADSVNYRYAFGVCLGRLLSYAPSGDDGIFPHEIIRNYFEENQNTIVIDHFVTGKICQRGAYLVTAGIEEKKIAKGYRSSAEKLGILYPHTAEILRKLANHYEQQALYEQKWESIIFRG